MHGKSTLLERLLSRVVCDVSTRCWNWTGFRRGGYGRIMRPRPARSCAQVHRVTYEHLVGPIPPGLDIDHCCRNRSCCNPDHLEPVTRSVNNLRAAPYRKARVEWADSPPRAKRTHCALGHPITATPAGQRRCLTCKLEWQRRKRAALPPATRPPGRPRSTVCVNGHPLTADNVYVYTSTNGRVYRQCRACSRAASLRNYYRRKINPHQYPLPFADTG